MVTNGNMSIEELKDKIFCEDCLIGMQRIPDGSVDAVICDLPYGTMKGIDDKHDWDDIIPTDKLFAEYERVVRRGGSIVLFSQEPYTSHLRTFKGTNIIFCYPMIWKKNSAGNSLMAAKAPVSHFEDINVFVRRADVDTQHTHPLRPYAQSVVNFIGKSCKEIQRDFLRWQIPHPRRAEHFLTPDCLQFYVCSAETYQILIDRYGIDKMRGFRTFDDLKAEEREYHKAHDKIFNLPDGAKSMSNVLEFSKDTVSFHPTQKPVELLRHLVRTYTNQGGVVLDNCSGSGTTAIACIKEKRHFIGFEKDETYWKKSVERVKNEQRQLTLF